MNGKKKLFEIECKIEFVIVGASWTCLNIIKVPGSTSTNGSNENSSSEFRPKVAKDLGMIDNCSAKICSNSRKQDPKILTFRFPKDNEPERYA